MAIRHQDMQFQRSLFIFVIVCSDLYQWIAQYNKNVAAEPFWLSRKYFRTRAGIESFLKSRGRNSQFYEDVVLRVSFLPLHFSDFLEKEKAAAKEKPLTTADLITWHYTGFVSYSQHFGEGIKNECK